MNIGDVMCITRVQATCERARIVCVGCCVRRATQSVAKSLGGVAISSTAATRSVAAAAAVVISNSRRKAATQYPRAHARFVAVREYRNAQITTQ